MGDEFSNQIINALKQYTSDIEEEIVNIGVKVARQGRRKLTANTPVGHSTENKLKDGWTMQKQKNANSVLFKIKNKNKPTVVHLVEDGHRNVDGSFTKGYKFVAPINQWCHDEYKKEIERKIAGG